MIIAHVHEVSASANTPVILRLAHAMQWRREGTVGEPVRGFTWLL